MFSRIASLAPKKLVGYAATMSVVNNKTGMLWQRFMTNRSAITNAVGANLYSMQVYPPTYSFARFNPAAEFEKWATIEVSDFDAVPEGMETYLLQGGLYAVFIHRGTPAGFPQTMQYIFGQWLPTSDYQLDRREHFELLGERYKNNDPASEEEVWIPIQLKSAP